MNPSEYNSLVTDFSKNLFRFLKKSIRDEEAVKDIMQDTFLKFWQHRNAIELLKAKSWLFVTAYRFMLKYIASQKKSTPLDELPENNSYTTEIPAGLFNTKEIIDQCLDTLPLIQKNILLLRDLEGYTYKEIAEITELTEEQVRVYLFRARQKIKNKIKAIHLIL